jgi:C-terminal processing protease CtpA/Prc
MPEQSNFEPSAIPSNRSRPLGVTLQLPRLDPYEAYTGQSSTFVQSILVRSVTSGGPAEIAGLCAKDLILKVNQIPLLDLPGASKDLIGAFIEYAQQSSEDVLTLSISRNKCDHLLEIRLEPD